jgi:protein-S-isoprenylcysteine O-methyltransferase Ste14
LRLVVDVMRALELKVPPPIVALLVAFAMWCVSRYAGAPAAPDLVRVPLAIALAVIGLAFDVSGFVAFRRARTTINPMKPRSASAMVDSGIYRVTRNPMYVGLFFMLLAWGRGGCCQAPSPSPRTSGAFRLHRRKTRSPACSAPNIYRTSRGLAGGSDACAFSWGAPAPQ